MPKHLDTLVRNALEGHDAELFAKALEAGYTPQTPEEQALLERCQADIIYALGNQPPPTTPRAQPPPFPQRAKTYGERRGTFIASTVGGYRRGIKEIAEFLGEQPPRGLHALRKDALHGVYWDFRLRAERQGRM